MVKPGITVGRLYRIPAIGDMTGFTQVVFKRRAGQYFFVVFRDLAPTAEEPNLEAVVNGDIALAGFGMDGKIHAGHWTLAGSAPLSPHVSYPAFRSPLGDGTFAVIDLFNDRSRAATDDEARVLRNESCAMPALFEEGLKAIHGFGEWYKNYDKYIPDENQSVTRFFGPASE